MNDSNPSKVFIIDTSALIDFSLWLPVDLNKVFWSKMEESLKESKWILLDTMVDEVRSNNDGLKSWCQEQKRKGLVKSVDDSHKNRAVEINALYTMIDESSGKSSGDTYLIAYAEANKLTIFTREKPRKNTADLYKIPDVCNALKLKLIRSPRIFLEAIGYKN